MYDDYCHPYARPAMYRLIRREKRTDSFATLDIRSHNMKQFEQRCGREVLIRDFGRHKKSHMNTWGGFVRGQMELDNGGSANAQWAVDGHCNEIELAKDKVNGVDNDYAMAMQLCLDAGAFDLVAMISKKDAEELEEFAKFGTDKSVSTEGGVLTQEILEQAVEFMYKRGKQNVGQESPVCICFGAISRKCPTHGDGC